MNLYRYQEVLWPESKMTLSCNEFFVLSETKTGAWIELYSGSGKRFVKYDARKKFACRTKEEALESYYARKRRQVRILRAQLQRAETALKLTAECSSAYID